MTMKLLLRLGRTQHTECVHCEYVEGAENHEEPNTLAVFETLAAARKCGAEEVILLRGESALRSDFLRVVRRTRDLGFGHIQVQTNGRVFSNAGFAREALNAGMGSAEVSLYSHLPEIHDSIARRPDALDKTSRGIQKLTMSGTPCHVSVPVLTANVEDLHAILEYLEGLYVENVHFNLTPPVIKKELGFHTPEAKAIAEQAVESAQLFGEQLGLQIETPGLFELSSDSNKEVSIIHTDSETPITTVTDASIQHRPFPPPWSHCPERPEESGFWAGLWTP